MVLIFLQIFHSNPIMTIVTIQGQNMILHHSTIFGRCLAKYGKENAVILFLEPFGPCKLQILALVLQTLHINMPICRVFAKCLQRNHKIIYIVFRVSLKYLQSICRVLVDPGVSGVSRAHFPCLFIFQPLWLCNCLSAFFIQHIFRIIILMYVVFSLDFLPLSCRS